MNPLFLLSVTAAAAANQTCDLHLRWNDGTEERVNSADTLQVYTASVKQRDANPPTPPTTNSPPWCGWFLDYAGAYDKANGEPPTGYVAPTKAAPAAAQTSLFPTATAADGVAPVTDPRALRRIALEAMGPNEYRAAGKAAGVPGFSRMKKADLVDAVLVAEFDKPAAPVAEEPAPEPTPAPVETPAAEPAPAEPEKAGKRQRKAKATPAPAETIMDPGARSKAYMSGRADFGAGKPLDIIDAIQRGAFESQDRVGETDYRKGWTEASDLAASEPGFVKQTAEPAPAADVDGWTDDDIRVHAKTALTGTAAQAIEKLNAFEGGPPVLDVLRKALEVEQAEKRPRKSVVTAIETRIAALTAPTGGIVAPSGGIVDGDTRPEVQTEGLGGSGVELGGGMGLGGGVELGGGLGTGEGELSGGLTGESGEGIGGAGRDATPTGIVKRPGAGCKQPGDVDGWEPGRVLVVVKPHRGEHKDWGVCEYRVRCDEDGGYTLLKLTGNRKSKDLGNLFEGKKWQYVSPMLTDLMGIPRDAAGKAAFHHRMTLRRWFALGRSQ